MLNDDIDPERWPAGRPAAPHSAFFYKAWEPMCQWGSLQHSALLTKVQTERIEKARAAGDNTGTIARLSNKSAAASRDATQWVMQAGPHGGAYSRSKARKAA